MNKRVIVACSILALCAISGVASAESAVSSQPTPVEPASAGFNVSGRFQEKVAPLPTGERIAAYAESFLGTPYDTDPLGVYVRSEKIICDDSIDCMYLVFRSAELGLSKSPEEAVQRALDLRFRTMGKIVDGRVTNYDERFDYGEDMVFSGKWGKNITAELGQVTTIEGARGRDKVDILSRDEMVANLGKLRSGDVIFFVKDPARRVVGEIVGHLGIIKVGPNGPQLIHASGSKDSKDKKGGGIVREVDLADYLEKTKFIGVFITRF